MKTSYLFLTLTTLILGACGGGGGGSDDNGDPTDNGGPTNNGGSTNFALGGCGVSGHRSLGNGSFPYNQFAGDSTSVKTYNRSSGEMEWYPLELSISGSTSRVGSSRSEGSQIIPTQACRDVLEFLTFSHQYGTTDHYVDLDVELYFSDFDYETSLSADNQNDEKITRVQSPRAEIYFEEKVRIGDSNAFNIVETQQFTAESMSCETPFDITTRWYRSDGQFGDDTTTYFNGDQYTIKHELLSIEANNCTFTFQGDITLKDNSVVSSKVWGGLMISYNDDNERKGYNFEIRGISEL
jgi:hypothetical protein